jgi:hypothetical protein
MRVHPTVIASTRIARFCGGRKVRCHKTGVEKFACHNPVETSTAAPSRSMSVIACSQQLTTSSTLSRSGKIVIALSLLVLLVVAMSVVRRHRVPQALAITQVYERAPMGVAWMLWSCADPCAVVLGGAIVRRLRSAAKPLPSGA